MKHVPQGYKQTDIGVIPEDWEVQTIDDVSLVISGGTPSTSIQEYWNGNINWFTPTEVGKSKHIFESYRKISIEGLNNSSAKLLPIGSILLTTRAGIGDLAILGIEGCTNQGFQSLISKDNINNEFLYYLVSTLKNVLLQNASGSTFLEISPNKLKQIKVQIPPKEEQKAIASALSDVDLLIASLSKLIAKKESIKTATMQQLLTGKIRLDGFSGEWEEKRLGDIANISRGASPRPIEDSRWFSNNSLVGWVRISDISKTSKYLNRTVQKLSQDGINHSRFIKQDNLIMSICATLGKPIITKIDSCIHDGFVVFNNLQIDKEFLYYFLFYIEKNWSKSGQTGSQMNLNTDLINSTRIQLPPTLQEQQTIAKILSDMDNEIEALKTKLTKTKAIKDGMMNNLLTGKIRLKGVNDE